MWRRGLGRVVVSVSPLEAVRRRLGPQSGTPLPRHWARFGDVLVLDVPPERRHDEAAIAEAFAHVMRCRSVVAWEGGIEGELRRPRARLLWGDPNTETVHVENGVRYAFDPARLMWSPGNLPERVRVARWDCRGQVVADLFAGIGYFTLPLLVHAGAERVVAIEKNPDAFQYLLQNAGLNRVAARLEARLGDNREVGLVGVADRVLLGYLAPVGPYLSAALGALKPSGGRLHVHAKVPERGFPGSSLSGLHEAVARHGYRVLGSQAHRVKSYAPNRLHGVFDLEVAPSRS